MAKRKPFRTYLSFLCMHMALRFDPDWVQFVALRIVRQRVEDHLRKCEELGIEPGDFDDLDESEHIIVTYH